MNSALSSTAAVSAPVSDATASFSSLGLMPALLASTAAAGHTQPTPIQVAAIPAALEGRDVLGLAQTGTGKTAAFVLPILQRLHAGPRHAGQRRIRTLVLSPTRELASQIEDQVVRYGAALGFRSTVIFGGVGQSSQVSALRRGVDILVATPGRLEDLVKQRLIDLTHVEVLVLDEADRMLDVGFLPAVRRLSKIIPTQRQTLFFSATLPKELEELVQGLLKNPHRAQVAITGTTAERVDQRLYHVDDENKRKLLAEILRDPTIERAVVFTRTKHGADRVAKHLTAAYITAAAIHGNKSQNARERALEGFRSGDIRVLVATDLASRGLDVHGITHVFNVDLPYEPEVYVHRIGRTARAGASGAAISFCGQSDRDQLRDIERLLRSPIPVVEDHLYAIPGPGAATGRGGDHRRPNGRPAPLGGARAPLGQGGGRGGRSGGGRGGVGDASGGRGAQGNAGGRAPSSAGAHPAVRPAPRAPGNAGGSASPRTSRTVLPGERFQPR